MTEDQFLELLLREVKKRKIQSVHVETTTLSYFSLSAADFNRFLQYCLEHAEDIKKLPTDKPKEEEEHAL